MRRPVGPVKRGPELPNDLVAVGSHRFALPPNMERERARLRDVISQKGVQKDGPYPLSAGGSSPYLFDLKPVMLDPEGCDLLGRLCAHAARELGGAFVGGRELGAIPLAAVIARQSFEDRAPLQGFFVRKQPKEHGLKKMVEGNPPRNADVVIVEDVTTTGASVLKTIREIEPLGARVKAVLTVVDREQGATDTFAQAGLRFEALLLRSDFPELDAL